LRIAGEFKKEGLAMIADFRIEKRSEIRMGKGPDRQSVVNKRFMFGCFGSLALVVTASILGMVGEQFDHPNLWYGRIVAFVAAIILGFFTVIRGYKKQVCPSCNHGLIEIGVRYNFCPKRGAPWERTAN
jgi:hypothetical protein